MKKLKCTLLVDDDEATNFINELLIEEMDFTEELLIVNNGQEAIDMIDKRCKENSNKEPEEGGLCLPELILLDINMPVMDGLGFLEEFRTLSFPGKETVTIVMLTTSLNPKDVKNVEAMGIYDFLNKPLTEEGLAALLGRKFN